MGDLSKKVNGGFLLGAFADSVPHATGMILLVCLK